MRKCSKLFNKKGDISAVIIALVFIIITFLVVPAFRGMQVDNTNASKALSHSSISFVNSGLEDAGSAAGYQLDTEGWQTTEADNVQ